MTSIPFSHVSVLLDECIEALNIRDGYTYVDCTTGGGGHSLEIAKRMGPSSRLICFDRDKNAIEAATKRLSDYLDSDRLYFFSPIIEAEEYRILDGWSKDKKKGSTKYEKIPVSLIDAVGFAAKSVGELVPDTLAEEFTAPEFSKVMGLRGRKAYSALKLLCLVGAVEKGEKKGRSFVYRRR